MLLSLGETLNNAGKFVPERDSEFWKKSRNMTVFIFLNRKFSHFGPHCMTNKEFTMVVTGCAFSHYKLQ